MRSHVNWAIFAGAGLLLAAGVTICHIFILPIAIHYQVTKTLALENGTEAWERFIETPIPIILKLYFFKLENPQEILEGKKPIVSEVGPYVYREYWRKHDVRLDEDRDSVFYRQGIEFVFDKEMSQGRFESDNVTTINPIIHLLATVMDDLRPTLDLIEETLELGLPEMLGDKYGPTATVTVRDILFDGVFMRCNRTGAGFVVKLLCSALSHYQPIDNLHKDQYGNIYTTILKFKEMGPLFEMSRGTNDPSTMGKIVSVDGKTRLSSWWCDSANQVDGFDLVMFPPFLTRDSKIPVHCSDIKTNVKMEYKADVTFAGIPGYKFAAFPDFLADVKENPRAKCYCPGPEKNYTTARPCNPGKGILDISSAIGLPAVLSLPHFYQASENWQSQVSGLSPQAEKHDSYLEIEPTTGIPLTGYRRIQLNVMTEPRPAVSFLKNHVRALVPLMWLEEGTSLGDKEIGLLKNQFLKMLWIESIIRWTLFSVGLLILILGAGMAVWKKRQSMQNTSDSDSEED